MLPEHAVEILGTSVKDLTEIHAARTETYITALRVDVLFTR